MTEKQIKKAVELAEGFDLWVSNQIGSFVKHRNKGREFKNIREWEHYPLLLYRAMESWNKDYADSIEIQSDSICYGGGKGQDFDYQFFPHYTPTPYLTAQEQALEAALE